jgi:hypothetical protein
MYADGFPVSVAAGSVRKWLLNQSMQMRKSKGTLIVASNHGEMVQVALWEANSSMAILFFPLGVN